jgi:His-Xaa-Ser system protein HxsD
MSELNITNKGDIFIEVDAAIFSKEAILKCLYWYSSRFQINLRLLDNQKFSIQLKQLGNITYQEDELQNLNQMIEKDLIDFQLRDIIAKETKNIRDLLVAKAFSNGEFDEMPGGEISDPVGFNPTDVK